MNRFDQNILWLLGTSVSFGVLAVCTLLFKSIGLFVATLTCGGIMIAVVKELSDGERK